MREMKLSGGEITVLKSLGLSGTPVHGKQLIARAGDLEPAEFLDTLDGLVSAGYVISNKVNIRLMADVEHAFFRVNASYARDLREAINPSRRREEDRPRRRRG